MGEKLDAYPLRCTEGFFAKFVKVAARISSIAAEDIFEATFGAYPYPERRLSRPCRASLGAPNASFFIVLCRLHRADE
jgi:hypothetical protein